MRTAQSTLHTAHCTLNTATCRPYTTHCILNTAHCKPHTTHCILNTAHCKQHTARLLHTAHSTAHQSTSRLNTSSLHVTDGWDSLNSISHFTVHNKTALYITAMHWIAYQSTELHCSVLHQSMLCNVKMTCHRWKYNRLGTRDMERKLSHLIIFNFQQSLFTHNPLYIYFGKPVQTWFKVFLVVIYI